MVTCVNNQYCSVLSLRVSYHCYQWGGGGWVVKQNAMEDIVGSHILALNILSFELSTYFSLNVSLICHISAVYIYRCNAFCLHFIGIP